MLASVHRQLVCPLSANDGDDCLSLSSSDHSPLYLADRYWPYDYHFHCPLENAFFGPSPDLRDACENERLMDVIMSRDDASCIMRINESSQWLLAITKVTVDVIALFAAKLWIKSSE